VRTRRSVPIRRSLPVVAVGFIARLAIFAATALAFAPGRAGASPSPSAGSVALRWNDCYGDGGASARNFACNTNSGVEVLVVSAYPSVAMPQLNGQSTNIEIVSLSPTLPSWWQMHTTGSTGPGCQSPNGAAFSATAPASASSCLNPWDGSAAGGTSYTSFAGGPNRARLQITHAVIGSVSVPASTEIFVCRVLISHSKTVGAGSCGGCLDPACIGLHGVVLTQPVQGNDVYMGWPIPGTQSDVVGWQADVIMPWSPTQTVFPFWKSTTCQLATEAQRPTWGAVKRLYR
jgi:hypothetical protein